MSGATGNGRVADIMIVVFYAINSIIYNLLFQYLQH